MLASRHHHFLLLFYYPILVICVLASPYNHCGYSNINQKLLPFPNLIVHVYKNKLLKNA